MDDIDITVPRSEESERQVLGSILATGAKAFREAEKVMTGEDFYSPSGQLIWDVVADLVDTGAQIDAIVVLSELRKRKQERQTGGPFLHSLLEGLQMAANVGYHARVVREKSQARRALIIQARMGQAIGEITDDHDALMSELARQVLQMEVLVDERDANEPVEGLMKWSELWRRPPLVHSWLAEDLLLPRDVMLLLAGEGGGKSWFNRQFVLCLAAGIHPFRTHERITPVRTLLCDLENAVDMLSHESRLLGHQVLNLAEINEADLDERSAVFQREDGINLRDRRDAMLLERVVAETRPQVLGIGSLYNTFRRAGDAWDTAAEEVRLVLNRIRRRYGCALIIEHHAPAAQGGARPMSPYGGSDWMKWPSLGRFITRVGANMYELGSYREADRLERKAMPIGLYRGGPLPWSPVWDPTELRFGMWDHVRKAKDKAGEHA